eukprot:CAMPEP_0197576136 /NCGR_PEP_ID=MMETSP1326-20131121/1267_1 /TAXON_ID=1155430 /ORGANISM="Genus nov. species nov., Strain RCC2288" /LENGTH=179 /DNA_ID=CAMNT_0043138997 /DNA_START=9 /DNA_END=547 /DNA_ORIENTATION=-
MHHPFDFLRSPVINYDATTTCPARNTSDLRVGITHASMRFCAALHGVALLCMPLADFTCAALTPAQITAAKHKTADSLEERSPSEVSLSLLHRVNATTTHGGAEVPPPPLLPPSRTTLASRVEALAFENDACALTSHVDMPTRDFAQSLVAAAGDGKEDDLLVEVVWDVDLWWAQGAGG